MAHGVRHKPEEPKTTIVLGIPYKDVRFIRMGIEMREYTLPAMERLFNQILKMLPEKEEK